MRFLRSKPFFEVKVHIFNINALEWTPDVEFLVQKYINIIWVSDIYFQIVLQRVCSYYTQTIRRLISYVFRNSTYYFHY